MVDSRTMSHGPVAAPRPAVPSLLHLELAASRHITTTTIVVLPCSLSAAGAPLIDRGRRPVVQRLVRPRVVVEWDIAAQPAARFARRRIVVQVHLLIFDRAPQPFGEDVVERAALAIHANLHARI